MRSETEKKTAHMSVKMSPSQKEEIERKAKEKDMTSSAYMLDCALHGGSYNMPQITVKLQEIINLIDAVYDDMDYHSFEQREELRHKKDDLYNLYQTESPKEKFDNLTNNIDTLKGGANDLWEYLK